MHFFCLEVANDYENETSAIKMCKLVWKKKSIACHFNELNSSWLISTNSVAVKVFIIIISSSFPFRINRLVMLYEKSEHRTFKEISQKHVKRDMAAQVTS